MKAQKFFSWLVMSLFVLGTTEISLPQADFCQRTKGPYGGFVLSLFINNTRGHIFAGTFARGLFRSTDNGGSWTEVNNGLTNIYVRSFASNSSGYIYVGTDGGGVIRSNDHGQNWEPVNTGLTDKTVLSLAINASGHIFAWTNPELYRSIDNGESWNLINAGPINGDGSLIAINPATQDIFAATISGDIYRSTDDGNSWSLTNTGLRIAGISALATNISGHLFVGTSDGGIFRSMDNGENWTPVNTGLNNTNISSLAMNMSGYILAGTDGGGVFLSTDKGVSWAPITTGLSNLSVRLLAINSNGFVFAVTDDSRIFRSVKPTTSVDTPSVDIPSSFSLKQNYPNPFNSTAMIEFSLPRPGYVTPQVYDTLGEDVAILMERNLSGGKHRVEWNASGFPSGVYFYRLHAGTFTQTKKLILLK